MGYDIVIQFKKPFIKCLVPFCTNKHYARGFCKNHYNINCRNEYKYSPQEYRKLNHIKKEKIGKKLQGNLSNTEFLYQSLKDLNINTFTYRDIVNLIGWKYERVKKHILKLIKDRKVYCKADSIGGRKKEAIFVLLT